jgi:hypothetical protein
MHLVRLGLEIAAIYSGVFYVIVFASALMGRYDRNEAELHTFHLGLCFILALGFLGLLLQ